MSPVERPSPPSALELAPGTVAVWQADLPAAGWHAHERTLLAADERARATRFVRAADGRRWAAARGILRALLGACLDVDPGTLRFVAGTHGKPRLADQGDGLARLRFNVSHAGDRALYALALDREVGVDVELPRARAVDHVAIARRALGEAQAARLASLEPPAREQAFLRAWVRWEAVLKCRGTGIGGAAEAPGGPEPWTCELAVDPPAAAALAVEGGPCTVRLRRWPASADG